MSKRPISYYYDARKKEWKNINGIIPHPFAFEIQNSFATWEKLPNYPKQEYALEKLFKYWPQNEDYDEILVKAATLNQFYNTNVYKICDVADLILKHKIDTAFSTFDANVINELNKAIQAKTNRYAYSFLTKYFAHHSPEKYPIYDSYSGLMLMYYRDKDGFCEFDKDDLLDYNKYYNIYCQFRSHFGLTQFNFRQLDIFLWQAGKQHMPLY